MLVLWWRLLWLIDKRFTSGQKLFQTTDHGINGVVHFLLNIHWEFNIFIGKRTITYRNVLTNTWPCEETMMVTLEHAHPAEWTVVHSGGTLNLTDQAWLPGPIRIHQSTVICKAVCCTISTITQAVFTIRGLIWLRDCNEVHRPGISV